MSHHRLVLLLVASAVAAGVACETPSHTRDHIGEASRKAREMMIDSGTDSEGALKEAIAMDGPTAKGVVENFRASETADAQASRGARVGIVDVSERD